MPDLNQDRGFVLINDEIRATRGAKGRRTRIFVLRAEAAPAEPGEKPSPASTASDTSPSSELLISSSPRVNPPDADDSGSVVGVGGVQMGKWLRARFASPSSPAVAKAADEGGSRSVFICLGGRGLRSLGLSVLSLMGREGVKGFEEEEEVSGVAEGEASVLKLVDGSGTVTSSEYLHR